MPTDPPQRWTIYVCENCGHHGFVFESQHSIPILECEPNGEHAWEHVGPYRTVEVVPALVAERLAEALREAQAALVQVCPPYSDRMQRVIDDAVEVSRAALQAYEGGLPAGHGGRHEAGGVEGD